MVFKRIPNKPRYDVVEDFSGREDPLALRCIIRAPLDCFRGKTVVVMELVAELELHFFDPT